MVPTQHEQEGLDDPFVRLLANYDEHLATGSSETVTDLSLHAPTEELQDRLNGAQEILRQLEAFWPRRRAADNSGASAGKFHSVPRAIGRFEINRVLGQGGAGIVYLARDPLLGREVALKVPRIEMVLTPSLRQRFLREGQAAALLNHPNIIPTLEVGAANDLCFIVYPFCQGPTLAERLAEGSEPISCDDAANLIAQLAEAIAHAHQRGILHRDLKPSNVLLQAAGRDAQMIEGSGNDVVPLITDFGLAKLTSDTEEVTRTGVVLGTPGYMAPEQTRSARELGHACDIWSLGVIFYELLTRRRPFVGDTPLEVMRQIQECDPASPRSLRKEVPRDLETICLKCLEKDPGRRYASAFELAEDLRRFQQGQPVQARPVPWWERLWKWARRRPASAALALVTTLAVFLAVGGLLWRSQELLLHNEELEAAAAREKKLADKARAEAAAKESALKQEGIALALAKKNAGFAEQQWFNAEKNYLAAVEHVKSLSDFTKMLHDAGKLREAQDNAKAVAHLMSSLIDTSLGQSPFAKQAKEMASKNLGEYQSFILLCHRVGEYKAAEKLAAKALHLADALEKSDHSRKGLAALSRTSLWDCQGFTFRDMGQAAQAANAFQKCEEGWSQIAILAPGDPDIDGIERVAEERRWIKCGQKGLAQLDGMKYQEAEKSLRKAQQGLAPDGGGSWIHNGLGNLFFETGRRVQAKQEYRLYLAAMEKRKTHEELIEFFLTCPDKSFRDPARAMQLLDKAKNEKWLALAHYRLGNYQKARDLCKGNFFRFISRVEREERNLILVLAKSRLGDPQVGNEFESIVNRIKTESIQSFMIRQLQREAAAALMIEP